MASQRLLWVAVIIGAMFASYMIGQIRTMFAILDMSYQQEAARLRDQHVRDQAEAAMQRD